MTEFEIASAVKNYVTSNEEVTNSSISMMQIRDELDTLRARMMLENERNQSFSKPFVGWTQRVDLKVTQEGGRVFVKLPKMHILSTGLPAAAYIGGTSEKTRGYRIVSGDHYIYTKNDPYIAGVPMVIYRTDELEFKNIAPSNIRIIGCFDDPSDLSIHGYDWKKDEYPVPNAYADYIIGKTAESYLRTMYRLTPQQNTQADVAAMSRRDS